MQLALSLWTNLDSGGLDTADPRRGRSGMASAVWRSARPPAVRSGENAAPIDLSTVADALSSTG
jgi:hypothetical protein